MWFVGVVVFIMFGLLLVKSWINIKLLKLKVKFVIKSGINGFINNGIVMWVKFCYMFVLLIVEVLYKFCGIVFNKFIYMIIMYG